MCGIVGYWTPAGTVDRSLIESMAQQLHHRGPDDSGVWYDESAGIALGHRRLAIIDLSPAGHQPMISLNGRYVIVFNGEIYNYLQLRAELTSSVGTVPWRGHSDTETLLEAISVWGVEAALQRAIGMFAFGVWDRQRRQLTLARDRLGEKPLYYGFQGKTFLFGSELKALTVHPEFDQRISLKALNQYLKFGYVPCPLSIYESIYKLPPGTFVTLAEADVCRGAVPPPRSYWSPPSEPSQTVNDEQEAVEHLDQLLRQSVSAQMVADVPVGAFLSGGVDSSTVVAVMQAVSPKPVRTFTIGFHEAHYNEAPYAKAVASYLGTDHTELYLTPAEAIEVIPMLPQIYDEPFADSSQIPTCLVARLARRAVTVCLSGDGGDELFAGYTRYLFTVAIHERLRQYNERFPRWVRRYIANLLQATPLPVLNQLVPLRYRRLLGAKRLSSHHRRRLIQLLRFDKLAIMNLYQFLVRDGIEPHEFLHEDARAESSSLFEELWTSDAYASMSRFDMVTYLPDDILVKLDRAAMSVSLESRVPLLDRRIVEYACRLPSHLKVREGKGKWILRQVLHRYVPSELVERPKTGFGVPIREWLVTSLRDWAEDLLSEHSLRMSSVFQPHAIRQCWNEHLSETCNWASLLWRVLMFQAWYQRSAKRSCSEVRL